MRRCDTEGTTDYISIYESEMRVVAGLATMRGNTETGGSLYGLWTQGGRPVILLVTGPGPAAGHQSRGFQQELLFFQHTTRLIQESGLQWLGDHHSHHVLGLGRPSAGDVAQVRSLAGRNHLRRWCTVIATIESAEASRSGWHWSRLEAHRDPLPSQEVKVNAFLYTDPEQGEHAFVKIRVLRGISPFRVQALTRGELDAVGIGEHGSCFPMDRIIYEESEAGRSPHDQTSADPVSAASRAEVR